MTKIELTDYMERQGCSQETLAVINDHEVTGRTIKAIMDNDMWDEILCTELKIINKITRFKIKSEMETASTGTKQDNKPTRRDLKAEDCTSPVRDGHSPVCVTDKTSEAKV